MTKEVFNMAEEVKFQMNGASDTFKKRTKGLHPKLQVWLGYMLATCPVDILVSEGVRTLARNKKYLHKEELNPV